MTTSLLTALRLRKSFGPKRILTDVDMELPSGSITALLGRSGAGKTTLIRAISLLEPPDTGELSVLGTAFQFPEDHDLARRPSIWPRLTVVFQDLFLWPHLTCLENITLAAGSNDPLGGVEHARRVASSLQLSDVLDRRPAQVSRGQRQLVALARALALGPEILLLDEITASLDVESSTLVATALSRLRDKGAAILMITHQLGFAQRQADRFMYIHDGVIIERGISDLLMKPQSDLVKTYIQQAEIAP